MTKEAEKLFERMNIPMKRAGGERLACGIGYIEDLQADDVRLCDDFYQHIADQCAKTWTAVERSIRTMVKKIWEDEKTRRVFEEELYLYECPKNGDLIKAIAARLERMKE